MWVRIIKSFSGRKFSAGKGAELDLPVDRANSLIKHSLAVEIDAKKHIKAKPILIETRNEVEAETKESIMKILDSKGIKYKKSFGLKKLKSLL